MRLHRIVLAAVVTFSAITASNTVHAAKKPSEADLRRERQEKKITKTLQAESLGVTTDRAKQLKALIDAGTDLDQAYWQAGYVKYYDKWIPLDEPIFSAAEKEQREQYVNYRKQFWGNDEENLKIARWCAEHNLADQAHAHLMAVLLNHPDNAELRSILGYQRIAGRWMNAEEYKQAAEEARRLQANLKKWSPTAISIRDGLSSADPFERNRALGRLRKIDDVDALPALELVLMPHAEDCALHFVDALGKFRQRDATLALCRAGVYSNWPSVRNVAAEELRGRPRDDFVFDLIEQLQTPLTLKVTGLRTIGQYFRPGRFTPRLMGMSIEATIDGENFYSKNTLHATENLVAILHQMSPSFNLGAKNNALARLLNGARRNVQALDVQIVQNDVAVRAVDDLRLLNSKLDRVNQTIEFKNDRIESLLGQTVGNAASNSKVSDWWAWWLNQADVSTTKSNLRREVSETDFANYFPVVPAFQSHCSCFIKGTPVWSEIGPVPIETLRVGDRVLAQNVDTGELTYRPVVRITVRQTHKPLFKIDLRRDSLTATPGHPFWVSGSGWVKARDLKPGQMVHTVTGAVRVDSVTSAPEEETHNLVVDGFHTYFVGNERALVHDVSLTAPTDAVVPGLIER